MDQSNPLINITLSMFEPERNCTAAGAFAAHLRRSLGDDDSLPVRTLREFILSCSNTTIGNFTDGNAVDWYRYTDAISSAAFDNFTANIQNKTSLCWQIFCENIISNAISTLGACYAFSRGQCQTIRHLRTWRVVARGPKPKRTVQLV
ncbi:hypothetical protein B0H65DRAFT_192672 [Neurospora tetraspora]|uniref:Uncharacterized protein n=1 Tax=Neurospora tetraspora TaxID=94610 RepID=A0AAE0JFF8_9PEZI|nr:hypothetical protein B0H65DRAFT_192672 [Neurospora tetraspora]